MLNTTTDIYRSFFIELEKIAAQPSWRERQEGARRANADNDADFPTLVASSLAHVLPMHIAERYTRGLGGGTRLAVQLPAIVAGHVLGETVSGKRSHLRTKGITPGIIDYKFSPEARAKYIDAYTKEGEIMPSLSEHIKRTGGSPVLRGPRLPEGGRVGTTTAHPFSGNKAKVANTGLLATGAAGLGLGLTAAHVAKHMKEPVLDILDEDEPERRLAVPIREPRRPSMLRSSFVGQFLPARQRQVRSYGY